MILAELLKNSDYKQSQFNIIQIHEFEQRIIVKNDNEGKEIPYVKRPVRNKKIKLTGFGCHPAAGLQCSDNNVLRIKR
jgi:hypothetical protein